MIPKECKRLAEVDFPIAVVSKHSAREKSIRHGHPSTLHLWWARRPLAACRSMLLALLLPDPCDPLCPEEFKEKSRNLLPQVQGTVGPKNDDLRHSLLKFIGDFANWDLSSDRTYLEVSRGLVKAAHPEETPLVVDPFSGGGSIPLEALRLGCEAFASDLNPVAWLIEKAMLEDIPRHGIKLADDLRRVGPELKVAAEKELAEFYPPDPDGSKPMAYLWARTVLCEAPNCGAEIPLARSFWLCQKSNRNYALRHNIVRVKDKAPHLDFKIIDASTDKEVTSGTMSNGNATCLCCGMVLPGERVRAQLAEDDGRANVIFDDNGNRIGGTRLLAVVTLREDETQRYYRLPESADYKAVWKAQKKLDAILQEWENDGKTVLCPSPDEPLSSLRPSANARGLSAVTRYGAQKFSDLFTSRQIILLMALIQLMKKAGIPSIALGKTIRHCNAFAFWHKGSETVAGAFGRHALPMSWDFPEFYPFLGFAGGVSNSIEDMADSIDNIIRATCKMGQVQLADAKSHPLPSESAAIWFTDPPYYDAIPYSDLSDFFYVWLKRAVADSSLLRDPFDASNPLTPKAGELVQSQKDRDASGRVKDKTYYEDAMAKAFSEGRRVMRRDGIASVVFAHKTTEGWEALLTGMIRGGWTVTGSWPIATERGARLLARDTAALATSIHLVCRPRPEDASVGDWGDVLKELPNRVGDWMERLQKEHIRGADLVFACIGPALEIFSRYSKVETADGREVKLAEYLEKVWEVVGRLALEQILGTAEAKARNGAAGALEEDSRLTALFLWTLQSTNGDNPSPPPSPPRGEGENVEQDSGEDDEDESPKGKQKGFSLVFDVVRRFAQPLGIHLEAWEGRIIETKKGVVRLFPISERAKQLFGEEGAQTIADRIESSPEESIQLTLFAGSEEAAVPEIKSRGRQKKGVMVSEESLKEHRGATTLDRVHAAMLLQASGRANALRALLKAEQDRSPDFLRLANALSALYPKDSEEKRLLDAMLLAVPR